MGSKLLDTSRQLSLINNVGNICDLIPLDPELLTSLLGYGLLSPKQYNNIKGESSPVTKWLTIVIILVNGTSKLFDAFLLTINQHHTEFEDVLSDLLVPVDKGKKRWSFAESSHEKERILRGKIQANFPELKENVESEKLLNSILSEGYISEKEAIEIQNIGKSKNQIRKLLELIHERGYGAYHSFFHALIVAGYNDIVQKIETTEINQSGLLNYIDDNEDAVAVGVRIVHRHPEQKCQLLNVPSDVLLMLKEDSIISALESSYNLKFHELQKLPTAYIFRRIPGQTNKANIVQLFQDCHYQNKICRLIWAKVGSHEYFKGQDHQYKVFVDVDIHQFLALSERLPGKFPPSLKKGMLVQLGELIRSTKMKPKVLNCEADPKCTKGSCIQVMFKMKGVSVLQSDELKAKDNIVLKVLTSQIMDHTLLRKTKQYKYTSKDVFLTLLKHRDKVAFQNMFTSDGLTILHLILKESRTDLLRMLFHANLLELLYSIRTNQNRGTLINATPLEMCTKLKLAKMKNTLEKLYGLEQSLNWLHRMARMGNVEEVEYLIKQHPELVTDTTKDGYAPIHFAVISGSLKCIQLLEKGSESLIKLLKSGDSLLTLGVSHGHKEVVDYMLKNWKNLDADMPGPNNKTALHIAIENGDLPMVKILHQDDVGVTVQDTDLMVAAKFGNQEIFDYLYKYAKMIDHQDWYGRTALFRACEGGHESMVQHLLKLGADITIQDKRNRNMFHACIEGSCIEGFKLVLEKAKERGVLMEMINQQEYYTGSDLIFLVKGRDSGLSAYHYIECQRFLIHKFRELTCGGGAIDVADYGQVVHSGWGAYPPNEVECEIDDRYNIRNTTHFKPDLTPLCAAILKEEPDIAKCLIQEKADVRIPDHFKLTALHLACIRGYNQLIDDLLKNGCQETDKDERNRTPLQAAIANEQTATIRFFEASRYLANLHLEEFTEAFDKILGNLKPKSLLNEKIQGHSVRSYVLAQLRGLESLIHKQMDDMGTGPVQQTTPDF